MVGPFSLFVHFLMFVHMVLSVSTLRRLHLGG